MRDFSSILVFGGLGFIGSEYILRATKRFPKAKIYNFDSENYATSEKTKNLLSSIDNYTFVKSDIRDRESVRQIFDQSQPELIINFAAESHVDNSINDSEIFLDTNIKGTFNILEAVRFLSTEKNNYLFHQVSTDEVFGDLDLNSQSKFSESSSYDPSSPYSASKAASDHLVRSWARTYKINYLITNCSNNFGPRQYPEKLIPKAIDCLINNKKIPIYGKGENVRDWIYVGEHVDRIIDLQQSTASNDTYLIGGRNELTNLELIKEIIAIVKPNIESSVESYINFIEDRKGHDLRYAIDDSKLYNFLGKKPELKFNDYLKDTVDWYQNNATWWK